MEVQTVLPESVRKQGETADALHRKLYPDQYPKTGGEQTEQGQEAPADAAKPDDKGNPDEQPKPDVTKVETGKGGEAKGEGTAEEWKQKYETFQGKYNAEVPQLHTTAAALRNQLQETLNRIKALEEEKAKPAEKKRKEPPSKGRRRRSPIPPSRVSRRNIRTFSKR